MRDRLVFAAQEQFGERGFANVSMDQLAEAAGVNVRAIYHYFKSKRALFDAAAQAAFETYGGTVMAQVFIHDDLRSRLHGLVEVSRMTYRDAKHISAFIGVVVMESMVERHRGGVDSKSPVDSSEAIAHALPLVDLNELLIDQAISRGELLKGVGRDAAIALLQTIGLGLGFAALNEEAAMFGLLDALDELIDGTLVLDR